MIEDMNRGGKRASKPFRPAFGYAAGAPISKYWSIHPEDQIPGVLCPMQPIERETPIIAKWRMATRAVRRGKIRGAELFRRLRRRTVMPTEVMDYLLVHIEEIPTSWKGRNIFFGTVYRNVDNNKLLRYMFHDGNAWCWSFRWVADQFGGEIDYIAICGG